MSDTGAKRIHEIVTKRRSRFEYWQNPDGVSYVQLRLDDQDLLNLTPASAQQIYDAIQGLRCAVRDALFKEE
jgi:hypothetical protein